MRTRYIVAGLACSLLLNVCMASTVRNRLPECGRVHIDDINRAVNVIPDERAALTMARLRLTKELMGKFGLDESSEYDITVSYDEMLDEWCVSFMNKNINVLDSSATIWLSGYYGVMNNFRW